MKKILTATLFAIVAASPAFAAPHHYRAGGAYDAGASYVQPDRTDVVLDGKIIGRDPDPFIREMLQREGDPTQINGGD